MREQANFIQPYIGKCVLSLVIAVGLVSTSFAIQPDAEYYTLKIKGITAGGVGMVSVDATGDVFFLEDASQFTGTYTAGTIGLTAAKGAGGAYFENNNGVVLKLRAKSTGLALSLGLGGFDVEFAEQ